MRNRFLFFIFTLFSGSAFAVDGVNLPGQDYANFDAPSAFVCRTTCGGESRCQAYTWVKPGIQGPRNPYTMITSQPRSQRQAGLALVSKR